MGSAAEDKSREYENEQRARDSDRQASLRNFENAMSSYQNTIAGTGPSVAGQQLNQGMQQAIAGQMSQAASQRGRDPASVQRQLMNNIAATQQATNAQAGIMRAQEVGQARDAMAGAALNRIGQADQAAGNAANTGAQIGQMDDPWSKVMGFVGAGAQVGASIAGAPRTTSDERAKTDIKDGTKKVRNFLDAIAAKDYKYKEQIQNRIGEDNKRHVSPMAQDLEKTEIGKSFVLNTPEGKMVDYGKGFGAMLAALADTNQRLKKLEG